ncbi:hypothetical protein KC349_g240 [Hortaea werneckii]|nr:hypothetical protein KC349_g240 [Hortaea werneckii]
MTAALETVRLAGRPGTIVVTATRELSATKYHLEGSGCSQSKAQPLRIVPEHILLVHRTARSPISSLKSPPWPRTTRLAPSLRRKAAATANVTRADPLKHSRENTELIRATGLAVKQPTSEKPFSLPRYEHKAALSGAFRLTLEKHMHSGSVTAGSKFS